MIALERINENDAGTSTALPTDPVAGGKSQRMSKTASQSLTMAGTPKPGGEQKRLQAEAAKDVLQHRLHVLLQSKGWLPTSTL